MFPMVIMVHAVHLMSEAFMCMSMEMKIMNYTCKVSLHTGEIDLQTSAPLSRFPKGQSQIELRFGVQVADSRTWTAFYVNGGFACSWLGGFLVFNESRFCGKSIELAVG
ncbi:hypothetical protein EGR_10930 [Echinococcus granulosus]|uniref:DUF5727 domain-containing protein n=1 Tax=Echinococcus granulosus TaxID=6210 RepID=W6U767_ECHGR|nr:hypothetical protein EGR_10930 [Echinococcus granulosus]EUB54212.1 hypothetical protein EGR_10930 [Echinococcus granulosus]